MKVTLVGSGGSAVSKRRACACVLVDYDTLIDCGPGALKNLRQSDIDLNRLERMLVSHGHADHVSDIVPLLWAMRLDERKDPFTILGPEYVLSAVRVLLKGMSTSDDFINFPLEFRQVLPDSTVADVRIAETRHAITTYAYRIDRDGRAFTYSADTSYSDAVATLAQQSGLLIHEATFTEQQSDVAKLTQHSTGSQAGLIARKAKVKQLALFHIPPPNERVEAEIAQEASKTFGGAATLGEDLLEFKL